MIDTILLILAAVCFAVGFLQDRLNIGDSDFVALGLFLWVLTLLL
jgi:hypothetical protein